MKNLKSRAVGLLREWLNEPPIKEKRLSTDIFSAGEIQPGGGVAGAIIRLVRRMPGAGADHAAQLYMYFVLREALPILDSAITNRRTLEGEMLIQSKDQGLQTELRNRADTFQVGEVDGEQQQPITGLQAAIDGLAINADTYGLGILEPALDETGQDIDRLLLPNPRTFLYRRLSINEPYRLYQIQQGQERVIDSPNVQLIGFKVNSEGPWPLPLAWGLPFVSEVAVRMFVSINNLWWRAGDPSQIWTIKYDPNTPQLSDTQIDADVQVLQDTLESILKNRRGGKISDGFIGFRGGQLEQYTVGGNLIISTLAPYFQEHYNVIASQIVGRSNVPVWMFPEIDQAGEGMGSSRSDHTNSLAIADAEKRNRRKIQIARNILNLWLILDKSISFVDRYEITWESANIRDEKIWEDTRLVREQANAAAIENGQRLADLDLIGDDQREDYLTRGGVLPDERA